MNLPRISVRNPVAVNLLMWSVIIGGLYSMMTLTRELFPTLDGNQIVVSVPYPSATPEEIETSVTLPIERGLQDLKDVKEIRSNIFEGISTTTITLEDGADGPRILNDVRGNVDRVQPDLPSGIEEPQTMLVEPVLPVIAVILHGDVSETTLRNAATDVRDDLLAIPGIAQVGVMGIRKREIWVEAQPEALEEHGLTFSELGQSIAAANLDLPGGQVKSASGNIRIRTKGETDRAAKLERLQIRAGADGASTRLSDVAMVKDTFEDTVIRGRFDGKNAVQLIVYKGAADDALVIAQRIKDYVSEHPSTSGGAVKLTTTIDLSRFVAQRLDLLTRNALWGLLLVGLTLAVFLDLRVAFWVAAGLPISLLGTFMVMQCWGITINLMTMFGMIVVLGLIVDDAIVIGENVFTKIRQGLPLAKAAVEGTKEVALPVIAAVITTVTAFLPLAFIEGQMGTMMRQLPLVMIAALGVSLVEAFIILPGHLGHRRRRASEQTGGSRRPTGLLRFAASVGAVKHRLLEVHLPRLYEPVVRFVLRWRYPAMAAAVAYSLVVAGLVQGGAIPFVFIQEADAETIMVSLEMAAGTSEQRTLEVIEQIEKLALETPEMDSVFAVVGASLDDRGQSTAADPATVGQLTLELTPADQRQRKGLRPSKEILAELRRKTAAIAGVSKLSFAARSGAPSGPEIEIRVGGNDDQMLQKAIAHVRGLLQEYDGVFEIEDNMKRGKLEVQLQLRETAYSLGLSTRDLAMLVRSALYGFEAQELQDPRGEIVVRVVLPESSRRSLADLEQLRIPTPSGGRTPLMEVASFTTERGFGSLSRVDGKRAVIITADVDEDRANADAITTAMEHQLADIGRMFPGVQATFEGQRKQRNEAFSSLGMGFPAALLGIYVIIAVLFRSYTQPFIVMMAIPYSLVGAILGHFITGYPFTLLSMIGGVALAGIVVNDSLILVDFVNHARAKGMPLVEAVVHGGKARLRAILLTSLTTISGLAPMMMERSFQAQFLIPMAVSIVFGLAFATVLTLLLIPVLYLILEDIKQWAPGMLAAGEAQPIRDSGSVEDRQPAGVRPAFEGAKSDGSAELEGRPV